MKVKLKFFSSLWDNQEKKSDDKTYENLPKIFVITQTRI